MNSLDFLTQGRLQRGVEHLHALGPRAIAEFLVEVAGSIGGMRCILGLLTDYDRMMTPRMLHATGGDKFPVRRLRTVP